jgi:O-antigen/teichoic acid export membrane protein
LVLVPALLAVLGTLGLEYSAYYYWNKGEIQDRHVLGTLGLAAGVLGPVLALIAYATIGAVRPEVGAALRLAMALACPVAVLNLTLTMVLLSSGRLLYYNLSRAAGPASYTLVIAALVIAHRLTVVTGSVGWVISSVLTLAVDFLLLARVTPIRFGIDRRAARQMLGFGVRTHAGTVAQYGNLRIDQALLAIFGSNRELGLYYVAVSLAEVIWYVPNSIGSALLARLRDLPVPERRRLTELATIAVAALTLLGTAFVFLFAPALIRLLLGTDFLGAVGPVRLLLPGILLLSIGRMLTWYFIASGEPGVAARAAIAGLAVALIADLALIPRLRADGASIASSITYAAVTASLVTLFLAKRPPDGGTAPAFTPPQD